MKNAPKLILSAVCALTLIGCSSSSKNAQNTPNSAAAAKDPHPGTIKSAFEIETSLRAAAKAAAPKGAENVTTATSSFILNLAAEKKLPQGVIVTAADPDGEPIEVWNGKEQAASAEDLAVKQTQLQFEATGTKVCMRLAQDANLFITDVPAMPEQLTQYPKASGITKMTTDGTDACKWAATK